jgi:hypothetical protein
MEILDNLRNEIKTLSAKIEEVSKKVEQPPVVRIDTEKLAAAVTRKLDNHTSSGETVAKRIEAAAARIPREIKNQYGIDPSTRMLLIVMTALVLVAVGVGYLATPRILEQQLLRQSGKIDRQAQTIENQAFEIEYYRSRNPKTAAQFDKEYRSR